MTYDYEPSVAPCERCGLALYCSCTEDDAPQTAMMLTQQEWDDLAEMVAQWENAANGWPIQVTRRKTQKSALAERIIEANQ
jgi:hypothetical protein